MIDNGQLIIIAALISGPLSALFAILVGRHLHAFDRASRNSISTSCSLNALQQDVTDMKSDMTDAVERFEKKQDGLNAMIERRDVIMKQDLQHIQQRLEDLNVKTEVTTVRLDKLEQSFNNTSPKKGIM